MSAGKMGQTIEEAAETTGIGHNTMRKLLAYAAEIPELCQQTDDDEQSDLRFEIDKSRISIRLTALYSEE